MKQHFVHLTLLLALGTLPAAAQETPDNAPGFFERGITGFMQQFFEDAGPEGRAIANELASTLDRMGPVLRDMASLVDDIRNYHAPERLENGDIVIRRREYAPPPPPVGENLRELTDPEPAPDTPLIDPDAPQISL